MKFSEVDLGGRFRFENRVYTKVTPLIAREDDTGAQRFVRRSAIVERLEQQPRPRTDRLSPTLAADSVRKAADHYHQRCLQCIEALAEHLQPEDLEQARRTLEQARSEFQKTLGL